MELSQLRAILALKDLASLAKVGEQMHLSSSAVFCQIRQLEDEIGQKLYERAGRRLLLTATGQRVAEHARKILAVHDEAVSTLKDDAAGARRMLRLGCGPHSSIRIAPHLLRAFLHRFPHSDIRLTASDDQVLLRDLRLGLLDAVLMSQPVGCSELTEEPLWSYEIVFVLPAEEFGLTPTLSVRDLRNKPFILYRRAVVIDSAYRELFQDIGFEPNVVMEIDEPDCIKELVKLGLGFAALPIWSVGDDARRGTLKILRPSRRHFHNYGLLYRKCSYRPQVLREFRQVAHEWREWWPLASYVGQPVAAGGEPGTR